MGLCLSAYGGTCDCLRLVEGKVPKDAPAGVSYVASPSQVKMGRPYNVDVAVRCEGKTASVAVRLNGKPLLDWSGPPSDLSLEQHWALPQQGVFGLGNYGGQVTFRNMRVKMLSGEARSLRPQAGE